MYFSRSLVKENSSELNDIIRCSASKNYLSGLTGVLVHHEGWFAQVLEGQRDKVSTTFNRLVQDYRHCEVTLVEARPIDERAFPDHWMGYVGLQPAHAFTMIRFGGSALFDPESMSAQTLLAFFQSFSNNDIIEPDVETPLLNIEDTMPVQHLTSRQTGTPS
jgi:hypothetical protein